MKELKREVRDVSEKATSLIKKIESSIRVFPFELRDGFKERIHELHETKNIEFSFQPPFQNIVWKVILYTIIDHYVVSARLRLVKEVGGKLSADTPIILSSHLN